MLPLLVHTLLLEESEGIGLSRDGHEATATAPDAAVLELEDGDDGTTHQEHDPTRN